MTNVSTAGIGMYASLIVTLCQLFGLDVDEGLITEVILAGITLVSFFVWAYGQITRKDLKFGLFRKA